MENNIPSNETPEEFDASDPANAADQNATPEGFEVLDPALSADPAEQTANGKVKIMYIGKQQELYLYAALGWNNFLAHQSSFTNFSPNLTKLFGDEQLAFIETTKAMPDREARSVEPLDAKGDLAGLNFNVLEKFKAGKIFINQTYTDPAKRATMLKAAGNNYLKKALKNNWSSTNSLIAAFKLFLTNYGQELIDSNQMPPGFPAQFDAEATPYLGLWQTYKDKWDIAHGERDIKAENNNLIYKVLSYMCEVGKILFANNKTLLKKFTISALHREVAGLGPAGVQGLCTIGGNKKSPVQFVNFTVKDHPDRTASSDKKGNYKLQLLSENTYTITATAEGFIPQTFEKYIKPGVLSRLNVALVPVPVEPPIADEV